MAGGLVIGLVGPLGAGKTQLVKGIALGNGLADDRLVTSPTFTLIHEYPGRLTLYHIDVYRLKTPEELTALGFHELLNEHSVVVVEWAERMAPLFPPDALWIDILPEGEVRRCLSFEGCDLLVDKVFADLTSSGIEIVVTHRPEAGQPDS